MFLGWQLVNDLDELEEISSGILEIDVKNGTCKCNNKSNTTLTMPLVLNDWLTRDLKKHNIQSSIVDKAHLTVEFNIKRDEKKKRLKAEFKCKSFIFSEKNEYSLEYQSDKGNNIVKITYNNFSS
jgi:hypothetical protein